MLTLKPLFGYMAENDISVKWLAEQINISPVALNQIRRTNKTTLHIIDKICTTLNLPISEVMRIDPD